MDLDRLCVDQNAFSLYPICILSCSIHSISSNSNDCKWIGLTQFYDYYKYFKYSSLWLPYLSNGYNVYNVYNVYNTYIVL